MDTMTMYKGDVWSKDKAARMWKNQGLNLDCPYDGWLAFIREMYNGEEPLSFEAVDVLAWHGY